MSFGAGKAALDRARTLTGNVSNALSGTGGIFLLLTDQLESGAIVSTDPVNGMSGQLAADLYYAASQTKSTAIQDAEFAAVNYVNCPSEV